MKLQAQIREDMVNAMKNRETEIVSLLRVVSGEFSRIGKDLSDDQAIKVIRKMVENAKELGNQNEVDILNKYLPQMFDYNQTRTLVALIIENNGYSTMKDMGNVMQSVKNHEKANQFDGKITSGIVKELLS